MAYKKQKDDQIKEENVKQDEQEKKCDCKNNDCCCEDHCECNEDNKCECNEEHDCKCNENNHECKNDGCNCKDKNVDLANEYLNMARIIQADFDNYRKRSIESIKQAKRDGLISAVEVILPSLDVFKKAKQMIKDENALKGIEMVENEINNSLKNLGVEKIDTQNAQFNPNFHYALSVVEDKSKPDNIIIDEYQAGYKIGDKVIKYSQVIVNKLKEDK